MRCDQAWPGGLKHGVLHECERTIPEGQKGHTGKHSNHNLSWWGGVLDADEEAMRDQLRAQEVNA